MNILGSFLFSVVFGAACALPLALVARAEKKEGRGKSLEESAGASLEDERGAAVRAAVWIAYRDLNHQKAPWLWRLSACLNHQGPIPAAVAITALEGTAGDLAGSPYKLGAVWSSLAALRDLE